LVEFLTIMHHFDSINYYSNNKSVLLNAFIRKRNTIKILSYMSGKMTEVIRVPAYQEQDTELKSQCCQKKKMLSNNIAGGEGKESGGGGEFKYDIFDTL
jgi:hypothetical protein